MIDKLIIIALRSVEMFLSRKDVACAVVLASSVFPLALCAQLQPLLPAHGDSAANTATPDKQPSVNTTKPDSVQSPYPGLRKIGGDVSMPVVVHTAAPQFSDEARKEKFSGMVIVNLIVDTNGRPQNVHVVRGVGMGLDEKALEAVRQYSFKPAMENGKPVPVQLNVQVNFQIFKDQKDAEDYLARQKAAASQRQSSTNGQSSSSATSGAKSDIAPSASPTQPQ